MIHESHSIQSFILCWIKYNQKLLFLRAILLLKTTNKESQKNLIFNHTSHAALLHSKCKREGERGARGVREKQKRGTGKEGMEGSACNESTLISM